MAAGNNTFTRRLITSRQLFSLIPDYQEIAAMPAECAGQMTQLPEVEDSCTVYTKLTLPATFAGTLLLAGWPTRTCIATHEH